MERDRKVVCWLCIVDVEYGFGKFEKMEVLRGKG